MRKDQFKNSCEIDMTAFDLNVGNIYKPKFRGKLKRVFRRKARRKLKQNIWKNKKSKKEQYENIN